MKKQTAVEWHFNATTEIYNRYIGGEINHEGLLQNLLNSWLQAKEMEKEQIIKAVNFGDERGKISTYLTAEQYYNETFKSE
jgi:hypothetical protein